MRGSSGGWEDVKREKDEERDRKKKEKDEIERDMRE